MNVRVVPARGTGSASPAERTQGGDVPDQRTTTDGPALPVDPGLCGDCLHASVKSTHRGTTYLRCTRAAWDERMPKYPRLPMLDCAGFERGKLVREDG
jgi:hypothetical protein